MKRYCIIGVGACGLPVVKAFAENGLNFDCFEALGDVGGIWNPESPHVVYGSTHLNSSEKLTRYIDLPFPEGLPYYLSWRQAEDYLRAYARTFGLYDKISFNKRVTNARREDGKWRIEIEGEKKPRFYDGLVVANGHHWHAKMPKDPGHFDGEILHSHDIKSKEQLRGKRVLVVGAGNSAVDILDDAVAYGMLTVHSMRRSYYFFPKTLWGKPTDAVIDRLSRPPFPRRWRYGLFKLGMRVLIGSHYKYGLPAPDHKLFEAHPTACNTYLDHIIHGRIVTRPGIERFDGKRVYFVDGTSEEVDLIIYATGFNVHFPFMDKSYILDEDGASKLFIHTFDRERDDLFAVGLFEPAEGGVWQLADYQARLIAAFLSACEKDPKRADWFRRLKADANPDIGHGIKWQDTLWHRFEIHHLYFRRYMKRLLKKFGLGKIEPIPQADVETAIAEKKQSKVAEAPPSLKLAS